jgi:hypothetical protein
LANSGYDVGKLILMDPRYVSMVPDRVKALQRDDRALELSEADRDLLDALVSTRRLYRRLPRYMGPAVYFAATGSHIEPESHGSDVWNLVRDYSTIEADAGLGGFARYLPNCSVVKIGCGHGELLESPWREEVGEHIANEIGAL